MNWRKNKEFFRFCFEKYMNHSIMWASLSFGKLFFLSSTLSPSLSLLLPRFASSAMFVCVESIHFLLVLFGSAKFFFHLFMFTWHFFRFISEGISMMMISFHKNFFLLLEKQKKKNVTSDCENEKKFGLVGYKLILDAKKSSSSRINSSDSFPHHHQWTTFVLSTIDFSIDESLCVCKYKDKRKEKNRKKTKVPKNNFFFFLFNKLFITPQNVYIISLPAKWMNLAIVFWFLDQKHIFFPFSFWFLLGYPFWLFSF